MVQLDEEPTHQRQRRRPLRLECSVQRQVQWVQSRSVGAVREVRPGAAAGVSISGPVLPGLEPRSRAGDAAHEQGAPARSRHAAGVHVPTLLDGPLQSGEHSESV